MPRLRGAEAGLVIGYYILGIILGCLSSTIALTVPEILNGETTAYSLSNQIYTDRRSFMCKATASVAAISGWSYSKPIAYAAEKKGEIAKCLNEDILFLPPPSVASELNGIDNMYFPSYLSGEWKVTQTLVNMQTPLGLKYIGGPNASVDIAEKSLKEARSKLDIPVNLTLRYKTTRWGVAEDRLFNTQARLNAFAEKDVVASVEYADVGGSNRKTVLALGGTQEDPLQTTLVYFRGPAAQKNFVTSHGAEEVSEKMWVGYEVQRSIFALTNQNTSPPITTDSEYIWSFERLDDNHVRGRLRIAGFLNAQSDTLYFDARNRAVSLQDYTLDMERV